jgi:hypothetical protein
LCPFVLAAGAFTYRRYAAGAKGVLSDKAGDGSNPYNETPAPSSLDSPGAAASPKGSPSIFFKAQQAKDLSVELRSIPSNLTKPRVGNGGVTQTATYDPDSTDVNAAAVESSWNDKSNGTFV